MQGNDAIRCIEKNPIRVNGQILEPAFISPQHCYIQYRQRLPSNFQTAVHYEIHAGRNTHTLEVRLDVERDTVNRRAVMARLGVTDWKNIIRSMDLNGATEDSVRAFAEEAMKEAFKRYESTLQELEAEYRQVSEVQASEVNRGSAQNSVPTPSDRARTGAFGVARLRTALDASTSRPDDMRKNMTEQEVLQGLVEAIKNDANLKNEKWQSLTYWRKGVGVALRRFKFYSEHLRISKGVIDFHLYIGLSDNLVVFNGLSEKMPGLERSLKTRYPAIGVAYETGPTGDSKTRSMKGSMVFAHFYVPVECTEMLKDVYFEVYNMSKGMEKGTEVKPNGPRRVNENIVESDVSKEEISFKKGKLMAIGSSDPAEVPFDLQRWVQTEYADGVKRLSEIGDDVHSWVSTVEDLAKKSPVKINDALVKPGILMIPPYQRKFAWREHDIRQLCRDLLKTDDKGHYHLGTVILHHKRLDDGREIWNVVDGQQRLTNIMAILRAPIFELPIKQFLARDYEMICQVLADYPNEEQTKIRDRLTHCTLAFISGENVTEAFQLFTTQNGRGKPLTPVNLLKAYHYKEMDLDRQEMTEEVFDELLKETERSWESANVASIPSAPGDGKLLLHVFREYLFRLRLWSRGKFPQIPFNARDIGEFKGVSIKTGEQGLPLQNGAVLRRNAADSGAYVAHRRADDKMNPYVSIDQTIVNGADFFKYVSSYVNAYKDVFCDGEIKEFYDFYMKNCTPRYHRSGAAMYARHVFEALCMFCYDRFGAEGVRKCFPALYACAYYERVSQSRVLYRKCGATYAPRAIEAMMTTFTAEDAQLALNELRTEVRLALVNSSYLKSLLKKDNPTKGEARQRTAYMTIAG